LLAHGRWFSPDTATSSTAKTGRHDIAEILLKVVLNTKKSNQSKLLFIKIEQYVEGTVYHPPSSKLSHHFIAYYLQMH